MIKISELNQIIVTRYSELNVKSFWNQLLFLMNMAIDIDDDKDEENEENGVPGCETHIESIL